MSLFNDNFITGGVIYLSLGIIDETVSHIFVIYSKKAAVNTKPNLVTLYNKCQAQPRHSLQRMPARAIGNLLITYCRDNFIYFRDYDC